VLQLRGSIAIPPQTPSEFDHGDVQLMSGRVFVAHTAADTVEVLDGEGLTHLATLPGCPEGSGIICAQDAGLVFAAARGAGKILVIQAGSSTVVGELGVGPRPNGLAWDPDHQHLLVADVQENTVRLLDPGRDPARAVLAAVALPGRPRWAAYDPLAQRFLVNIREPACVAVLAAETATLLTQWAVSVSGPHGLDLDLASGRALVACDGGAVVALDLASGQELGQVPIAGGPDAIWFNPQRRLLYVAIAEPGVVEVVDTQAMVITQQVETERDAHTTAFDAARQRLYVFLPSLCRAAVYEEVQEV
jgi:DNA-binding beta-propeller fold protein YncE